LAFFLNLTLKDSLITWNIARVFIILQSDFISGKLVS
jgi:hypothetical protein